MHAGAGFSWGSLPKPMLINRNHRHNAARRRGLKGLGRGVRLCDSKSALLNPYSRFGGSAEQNGARNTGKDIGVD